MASLRAMWVLSVYGVSTVVISLLTLLVSMWSEEEARALARVWAKANLWVAGIKVEVEGKENLPISKVSSAGDDQCGFIIAANHTSAADIFAILAGLQLDICWVSRASLTKTPFLGWSVKRLYIPLARGSVGSAKSFIKEGTCKLDAGAAVVVFPEGTWKEDPGPMLPFKKGSFLLARNTKRPIVPVAIIGSQDLLPPETLIPKKGTIELRIGVPIDPNEFSDLEQLSEETYRAISELLEGGGEAA